MLFQSPGVFYAPVITIPPLGNAVIPATAPPVGVVLKNPNVDQSIAAEQAAALVPVVIPLAANPTPLSAVPGFVSSNPAASASAASIRAQWEPPYHAPQRMPPIAPIAAALSQPIRPQSPALRDLMLVLTFYGPVAPLPRGVRVAPILPPPPVIPRPLQQFPLILGPAIGV